MRWYTLLLLVPQLSVFRNDLNSSACCFTIASEVFPDHNRQCPDAEAFRALVEDARERGWAYGNFRHPGFVKLPLDLDIARLQHEVLGLGSSFGWVQQPGQGSMYLQLVSHRGGVPPQVPIGKDREGPFREVHGRLSSSPYVREVLAKLRVVLGRVKLLRVPADGIVRLHRDAYSHVNEKDEPTLDLGYWGRRFRIHVPIFSDPSVEFSVEDVRAHLEPGSAYVFDSSFWHQVLNPSDSDRLHLVIDTVGTVPLFEGMKAGTWLGDPKASVLHDTHTAYNFTTSSRTGLVFESWADAPVFKALPLHSVEYFLRNLTDSISMAPADQRIKVETVVQSFLERWVNLEKDSTIAPRSRVQMAWDTLLVPLLCDPDLLTLRPRSWMEGERENDGSDESTLTVVELLEPFVRMLSYECTREGVFSPSHGPPCSEPRVDPRVTVDSTEAFLPDDHDEQDEHDAALSQDEAVDDVDQEDTVSGGKARFFVQLQVFIFNERDEALLFSRRNNSATKYILDLARKDVLVGESLEEAVVKGVQEALSLTRDSFELHLMGSVDAVDSQTSGKNDGVLITFVTGVTHVNSYLARDTVPLDKADRRWMPLTKLRSRLLPHETLAPGPLRTHVLRNRALEMWRTYRTTHLQSRAEQRLTSDSPGSDRSGRSAATTTHTSIEGTPSASPVKHDNLSSLPQVKENNQQAEPSPGTAPQTPKLEPRAQVPLTMPSVPSVLHSVSTATSGKLTPGRKTGKKALRSVEDLDDAPIESPLAFQHHHGEYLFVTIPKCGSTSLHLMYQPLALPFDQVTEHHKNGFGAVVYGHYTARMLRDGFGAAAYDNYITFAIVRNPFARAVSLYAHVQSTPWGEHAEAKKLSFVQWLQTPGMLAWWGGTMKNYVVDEQGYRIVKRLYHLENRAELKLIANMVGYDSFPFAVGSETTAAYQVQQHFYSEPEALCLVAKIFAEDFEFFGYDATLFEGLRVDLSACQWALPAAR